MPFGTVGCFPNPPRVLGPATNVAGEKFCVDRDQKMPEGCITRHVEVISEYSRQISD